MASHEIKTVVVGLLFLRPSLKQPYVCCKCFDPLKSTLNFQHTDLDLSGFNKGR